MKTKHLLSMPLAFGLALCWASALCAQHVTSGSVELGGRRFEGTLGSSKFTEYRDLPAGMFVNAFSLHLLNTGHVHFLSLWGSHVGQRDQNFAAQLGVRGKVKLELEWGQTPHNYTNTARTVFSNPGSGELVMPDLLQNRLRTILTTDLNPGVAGVQFDTSGITNLVLGSARGVDVVSRRGKGKATLGYSPTQELDVKFHYSNEQRTGVKPLGGNFAFNPVELIEPTDYRTQEVLASLEYAAKGGNVQLGYSASLFDNNVDVLVWDNPFNEIDAATSSSRGRIDLYPNNTAQRVSFSGAANLPSSTRLMTTASYGWRRQNDPFIPYTINAVAGQTANFALPATSLNGKVGTTLVNFSLVNRSLPSLWLNARYRFFDYDNQTPSLIFPGYVGYDQAITRVQRRNVVIGYKRTNASVDATLRPGRDVSLKAGYEREDWDRKLREAEETHEDTYKASLDYTPHAWLLLRTSYSFGAKKTPHYDEEEMEEEAFPAGEPPGTLGNLPQLRKFDQATRDRNRANVLAQVTPSDRVTFTTSFGLANDKFKESEYGLRRNRSNNFSFDVSLSPTYDLGLFASYTRENFNYATKSRQRVPQAGATPANDTTNNDWGSDLKDAVNTFGAGLSWSAVPEKVDVSLDFSSSDAKGTIATRALGNSTTPGFLVTTAQDYPDTRSRLHQLRSSVGYRIGRHLTQRLEYRFERYTESYFNQDVMMPYMLPVDPGTAGGVFLGARQPGYSAHILYLVLSSNF